MMRERESERKKMIHLLFPVTGGKCVVLYVCYTKSFAIPTTAHMVGLLLHITRVEKKVWKRLTEKDSMH